MKRNQTKNWLFQIKSAIAFSGIFIVLIIVISISFFTISKASDAMTTKASTLISALNVQLKMNIDNYLNELESTGMLIFSDEDYYQYNPSETDDSDYERIQVESQISDQLVKLGLMKNFGDFCITYESGKNIGKISNSTRELYGTALYSEMEKLISRERTADGWGTGYNGDYKRLYYVKRLNPHALLVTSFYTSELQNVFRYPAHMGDMTIRLINADNRIIYSSAAEENGQPMPSNLVSLVNDETAAAIIDASYLVTVNACDNNWRIVCSIPTDVILAENTQLRRNVIFVSVAVALTAVAIVFLLSILISKPYANIVVGLNEKAETDQLTKVLNKVAFEEHAAELIRHSTGAKLAFFMIDIDNFKTINDVLGHQTGDRVLADIGDILRDVFCGSCLVGRLGGDEFAVLITARRAESCEYFVGLYDTYRIALQEKFEKQFDQVAVTSSVGIAVSESGEEFRQLYRQADTALYHSKRSGKNTCSIYRKDMEVDAQ